MMRSLWTAASGMNAQQMNIDTIANNLANVNTTAYKKEKLEFKTLLYQTMNRANANGNQVDNAQSAPVNLQIGLGVRPVATARNFEQGIYESSDSPVDFCIVGEGFFVVDRGNGVTAYTRDGSFKLSDEDDGLAIVTSLGEYILDVDGEPIIIPEGINVNDIAVSADGVFSYLDEDGDYQPMGIQFDIVQFPNRQGLEAIDSNLYLETGASGEPLQESMGETNTVSTLKQSYLEASNVQLAEEMVKLIVAQRAYEVNSKAIQTSDDMLSQANQLKR